MAMWGGAALLFLLPLAAMQLGDEVEWDAADFILVGAMLGVGCGAVELAARRRAGLAYEAAVGFAVAAAFLTVFANGAVGIIGDEGNPVNLLYFAVPALALVGGAIARFRPGGMAAAMAVAAGVQVLAGLAGVALVPDYRGLLIGTALFTPLWLLSAWLFAKAERELSS
jgi:hypothetical protein